jgi:hypothetical protein
VIERLVPLKAVAPVRIRSGLLEHQFKSGR